MLDELDPIGRCLRIAHKRGEALRLAREAAQQQNKNTRSAAFLADDTDRADDTLTSQQEVKDNATPNSEN